MADLLNETFDSDYGDFADTTPCRLMEKDGVLGYLTKKKDGTVMFERKTNFSIVVIAHVKNNAQNGALMEVKIAESDEKHICFSSMADMSRSDKFMAQLNKSCANGLWSSGFLDPDLPAYINNIVGSYLKDKDNIKRLRPVQHVGRQADGTWVLNNRTQLDRMGNVLPRETWRYVVVPGLFDIPEELWVANVEEFDDGDALIKVLNAARALLGSNFIPTVMVIASCIISMHYDELIGLMTDGSIPICVAVGAPDCGKSTALKTGMSLLGHIGRMDNDVSYSRLLRSQTKTTMGIPWDDPEKMEDIKSIVMATYSKGGKRTMKSEDVPLCAPIITTNQDMKDKRVLSRMAIIPFATPTPRLSGKERLAAEKQLKQAISNAPKSIPVLIRMAEIFQDDFLDVVYEEYAVDMEQYMGTDESRSLRNYALIVYVTVKLLERTNIAVSKEDVWHYMEQTMVPYHTSRSTVPTGCNVIPAFGFDTREALNYLIHIVTKMDEQEARAVVNFYFEPQTCGCGDSIGLRVEKAVQLLQDRFAGIHKNTIENHIKERFPCCRGKIKFRTPNGEDRQERAIHFKKTYLDRNIIAEMERAHPRHLTQTTRRQPSNSKHGEGGSKGEKLQTQTTGDKHDHDDEQAHPRPLTQTTRRQPSNSKRGEGGSKSKKLQTQTTGDKHDQDDEQAHPRPLTQTTRRQPSNSKRGEGGSKSEKLQTETAGDEHDHDDEQEEKQDRKSSRKRQKREVMDM